MTYDILELILEFVFDFCVTFIHNCGSATIIIYHFCHDFEIFIISRFEYGFSPNSKTTSRLI